MVEIKGRQFCENCFKEISSPSCPYCGYDPSITQSDPTMMRPGSVLLGKYVVGKVIGKGGFGVTYLAYDVTTDRKVAIKEFFPYGVALRAPGTTTVSVSSMDNAEAFKLGAEKFYNEAKLVSRFNGNPNIVGVHEFFYENDTVYFAMEYLEGHTLKDHIAKHGNLTPAQALFIMQNVANALMAAHSSNVLHRDISPDNIILCDNGDVKLIDFGAARQVVAEHSQSFSVILKPGFAPLEQYQKKGNQGPWTDIYSLGTTIYYSLTGDIPEDPMSRIDDDEAFSSNQYNINSELWAVIYKAAGLKIEDRYSDVFMLKNDLSKISFPPEPVITPKDNDDQMPEFQTAVPYGMTRNDPAKQPVAAGGVYSSTVQQGGAIQQDGAAQQSKPGFKEFITKHIFAVAGVLAVCIAVAIIIPIAVSNAKPTKDPYSSNGDYSNSDYSSSGFISVPVDPFTSSTSTAPSTPPEYVPQVSIPSDRVFYSTLLDGFKPLYETIYSNIQKGATRIDLSADAYTAIQMKQVFYEVLYDNPNFYNTTSVQYVTSDSNGNGVADDDEYVISIQLVYLNAYEAPMESSVLSYLNDNKGDNIVETLCELHDALILNVTGVERYSTETCTSAYGALVDQKADDMGLSKAFCLLAQKLGLKCVVVDGVCNGEIRSWCRVNIDGTWYNVDVYGDMNAGSEITKVNFKETETYIFHTYFLTNDEYMKYCSYTPNSEYNFLLSNEFAANSDYANYFIGDGINGKNYIFCYEADDAYEELISWAAERYQEGSYESSIRIASFIVDDVVTRTKNDLVKDLKSRYGITVSGFSGSYNARTSARTITLKP